jgi:hypothetical protein
MKSGGMDLICKRNRVYAVAILTTRSAGVCDVASNVLLLRSERVGTVAGVFRPWGNQASIGLRHDTPPDVTVNGLGSVWPGINHSKLYPVYPRGAILFYQFTVYSYLIVTAYHEA